MDIKELKRVATENLKRAKAILVLDGEVLPMLYAVSDDGVMPIGLHDENEEDQKEISEIMEILADTCESMFLIIDMHYKEFDKKPDLPPDVKGDPEAGQALVCFLHTEEESFMRLFAYEQDEKDITFSNYDWEKMDEMSDKYENPFTKK